MKTQPTTLHMATSNTDSSTSARHLRAAGGGGLDQRSHFLRWAEGLGGPGLDAVHVHHVAAVDEGCYPEAHVEPECRHARKHCVRLRELLLVQSQIVVPAGGSSPKTKHSRLQSELLLVITIVIFVTIFTTMTNLLVITVITEQLLCFLILLVLLLPLSSRRITLLFSSFLQLK